jgi:predicted dehydrogenase
LNGGVDVFVEKPMCRTLEEADELVTLAKGKRLLIQVGHLERFNPAIMALQKEIDHPMFIESHRLGFFKERGVDVDVVLDLMIHDLDIILSLVKSEIVSIHALGVPVMTCQVDIANARLVFESGCVANVTASRISMKTMRKIRIFQPSAYLSVDYAKRDLTVIRKMPGSEDPRRYQILPEYRQFPEIDPLEEELTSFVTSVQNRSNPLVDGIKGRRALKVSLEVVEQISLKLEEHNTLSRKEKISSH